MVFLRGGPGTGGFLEGGSDEQLSDINNLGDFGGNHGWGELAEALRSDGFQLSQIIEPGSDIEASEALIEAISTSPDVIVFGSNNRLYGAESEEALADFVFAGGGVLFISDANWGINWGAASTSDQTFLTRHGVVMNQDNGVYTLSREAGDFTAPDHPILEGVGAFDGEGVTPVTVVGGGAGITILARAKGELRQNNTTDGSAGSLRAASTGDAALLALEYGRGRIVCHFDRNTFFNANGAGTNIGRFDNRRLARNIFAWLAEDNTPGGTGWEIQ